MNQSFKQVWTSSGSCILPPLPLEMNNHPTVDFVNSTLVTCYLTTCYSLFNSRKDSNTSDKLGWDWEAWTSLVNSVDSREDRRKDSKTSVTEDKLGWDWEAWTDTLNTRAFHTSAITEEGILLVGWISSIDS